MTTCRRPTFLMSVNMNDLESKSYEEMLRGTKVRKRKVDHRIGSRWFKGIHWHRTPRQRKCGNQFDTPKEADSINILNLILFFSFCVTNAHLHFYDWCGQDAQLLKARIRKSLCSKVIPKVVFWNSFYYRTSAPGHNRKRRPSAKRSWRLWSALSMAMLRMSLSSGWSGW